MRFTSSLDLEQQLLQNVCPAKARLETEKSRRRLTLLLSLDADEVFKPTVNESVDKLGYSRKHEFHVTAFDVKADSSMAAQLDALSDLQKAEMMRLLLSASEDDWDIELLDEYYAVEKQYPDEASPRESLVQMVHCSRLDELYAELDTITGDEQVIEKPPFHITLGTKQNPRGIGIQTHKELFEHGKLVIVGAT